MVSSVLPNRAPLLRSMLLPLPCGAVRCEGELTQKLSGETTPLASLIRGTEDAQTFAHDEAVRIMSQKVFPCGEELRYLRKYTDACADRTVAPYLLEQIKQFCDTFDGASRLSASEEAEILSTILWLYNLCGSRVLLTLCARMDSLLSRDWTSFFHTFTLSRPAVSGDDLMNGAEIADGLRIPALRAQYMGGMKNETAAKAGYEKLLKLHGTAHGLFNADPLLAGSAANRGIDRETVLALLRSFPDLLHLTGDSYWGDCLEALLYNTGSQLDTSIQYANCLHADTAVPCDGLWEAAASSWMTTADGGLAAILYAPCTVRWRIHETPVRVTVSTDYPRSDRICLRVQAKKSVRFPLALRIPMWAQGAELDGKPVAAGTFAVVERDWGETTELTLTLPLQPRITLFARHTLSISCGPRIFALDSSSGTWNYAIPENAKIDVRQESSDMILDVQAGLCPSWKQSGGFPASTPVLPLGNADETIHLIPYSACKTHIAQFPILRMAQK